MKNKKNILIVEDEVILSNWLEMLLEDEGFLVSGKLTSGEEAIEFVQNREPELILMDINLFGEIDGIEAAETIIESSQIPIIYMTGYDKSDIYKRARKTNPIAILTKPVEIWDLKPIFETIFDDIRKQDKQTYPQIINFVNNNKKEL